MLIERLVNAPVHVMVPSTATLERILRQIAGLRRWGRAARAHRVVVP
jgi:hypothetical protein